MNKVAIFSENAPRPVGPYSQGIRVGEFVFVSGQIAIDPDAGDFVDGDVREQTRRVLRNVDAVLVAGGSSLGQAVKLTVYLTNIDDFSSVNEVFNEFFSEEPPTREAVEVSGLPKGAKIEISAIGLAKKLKRSGNGDYQGEY